jgi:hypothetical protein
MAREHLDADSPWIPIVFRRDDDSPKGCGFCKLDTVFQEPTGQTAGGLEGAAFQLLEKRKRSGSDARK